MGEKPDVYKRQGLLNAMDVGSEGSHDNSVPRPVKDLVKGATDNSFRLRVPGAVGISRIAK